MKNRHDGTKYQIKVAIRNNNGKNLKTKWTKLPTKSPYIEIDWKASAVGQKNGYIKLWVNGDLKKEKLNVGNDNYTIEEVRFGLTNKIKDTFNITGHFHLDAFDSDSE